MLYRRDQYDFCTAVGPDCPLAATTYGYYPNLGANAFFLAIFAFLALVQLFLGLRARSWTFLIALFFGTAGEAIGYIGRILLHNNPFSGTGFKIQICCLIIAPAFLAAGVYLTLKHIVIELGSNPSLVAPTAYTWIFILCDILSIVLQAAGGGTASAADGDPSKTKAGNNLMIAGVAFQVVTLTLFASLVLVYVIRRKWAHSSTGSVLLRKPRFQLFCACITLAFLTIFIRCAYRIAEMADGWQSAIMQNETDFIVLDSVMITLAAIALTIAHPGLLFPEMQAHSIPASTTEKSAADLEASPVPTQPASLSDRQGYFGRRDHD